MRFHAFKINESANRTRSDVLHHMRRFIHVYTKGDRKHFSGHIETIIQKPKPTFGVRFHVGNAGSETPFDGHLTILGSGLYWGLGVGRKLAHRLTTNPEYKYDGRDISLAAFEGRLYLKAWVPQDRWMRGEFASWRDSSYRLNPLDVIFGEKRYTYEDVETASMEIEMPEGSYPVVATLQKQHFGRPRSKRTITSYCVDVNSVKGIPDHYDSSGGWKGDRVYGFSVKIREPRKDWEVDAKNLITARILEDRGNSGFREAQTLEND